MKAKFIDNVPNARLLRNRLDEGLGIEQQYFIERCVMLKHHNFMYFRDHLSGENDIVKMHNKDMFVDVTSKCVTGFSLVKDIGVNQSQ